MISRDVEWSLGDKTKLSSSTKLNKYIIFVKTAWWISNCYVTVCRFTESKKNIYNVNDYNNMSNNM